MDTHTQTNTPTHPHTITITMHTCALSHFWWQSNHRLTGLIRPLQRKRQYASTSSGFVIWGPEGQRWLLTNAHSVEYHSQVPPIALGREGLSRGGLLHRCEGHPLGDGWRWTGLSP